MSEPYAVGASSQGGVHAACHGCCSCLSKALPASLGDGAAGSAWLLEHPLDDFFTAADYFAVQVVWNAALSGHDRIEAARAYDRQHGRRALIDALDLARGWDGLPVELDGLRQRLVGQGVA